jgi:hypothetical protein
MSVLDMTELEQFMAGQPGVYRGISEADYHEFKRPVSSSILKELHNNSPLHALELMNSGKEATDEMSIGSGGHCRLFTPSEFDNTFICATTCCATVKSSGLPCEAGGKIYSGGKWYCGTHGKGLAQDTDKTVLTPEHYERVCGICDAVRANEIANAILENATDTELSILWEDDVTGLLLKARIDIYCQEKAVMPDLKCCRSIRTFNDDAYRRGYQIQLAMYQQALMAFDLPADCLAIIACENDRPHPVATPEMDEDLLAMGRQQFRLSLNTFADCMRTGHWPGPVLEKLTVPERKKWQDRRAQFNENNSY